jgi:UDP-N-acetylmuramoyl-L-alanyl-D-glutamate--2,6-diaminopimelate ligase
MLRGVLGRLGAVSAVSSTVERRIGDERVVSGLTTPEATDMHALVGVMRDRGVETAAFEVSAQAMTRHRVDGLVFDVVGFTNLSHDHLDDYGDMELYFDEKVQLFTGGRASRGVVSLETDWGRRLVERAEIPVVTIGAADREADAGADWLVRVRDTDGRGTALTLLAADGRSLEARSPVPGAHMARNMALAIVMLLEAGYGFDRLAQALADDATLPAIPGRTENISAPGGPAVYLDFGHSADAFKHTLAAVRSLAEGRVFMVFGADGDRDSSKRADMAAEAALGSDVLIITDHHPRFEDPHAIRRTLAEAALSARPDAQLHVVWPPPEAIRLAVKLAKPGDAILWAGPGHQNYRDIEGVRTRYSAREEASAALIEEGYASTLAG